MHIDKSKTPEHDYVYIKTELTTFVYDYKSCLLELNRIERKVLKLWYDDDFRIDHTPEEISEITGLKPDTVCYVKELAMNKVRNNPKMQKYKGLLNRN